MLDSTSISSLLDAKLTVPQPPVSVIHRNRVVSLIDDEVRNHPVTLVIGGAGTGKTLAVADWARQAPWPVAWVSIDRSLRSPVRAWLAIILALERCLGPAGFESLRVPESVDEEFVELVAASLEGRDVCLVLDDVHELDRGEGWDGLDHFLRLRPAGVRLVLIARHDPPLALNRLRVAGELGEVRASHLTFSDEDARLLLADRELSLPDQEFRKLMTVTEGWPAGLRLALMTLEAAPDPIEAVRQFSGREVLVAGYLMEQVLDGLEPERLEFLLLTSVEDQMCGALARALTGDRAAEQVLHEMARENILVTATPGSDWYRYHPLMLQMLRARLHAEDPNLERDLRTRAAEWHEAQGEWLTALEQAIASENWDLVGQVAMRSAFVEVFSGDRSELAELAARVPPEISHNNPELQLLLALGAFIRADSDAGRASAAAAARGIAALPEPRRSLAQLNLSLLEAFAARGAGDASALVSSATGAVAHLERIATGKAPGWAAYSGVPRAMLAVGELWSGHPLLSRTLLKEALAGHRGSDLRGYGSVYHSGYLALAEVLTGRIVAGRTIADAALEEARTAGAHLRRESAAAWLALASAAVQRGDARAAERALNFGNVAVDRGRDPFLKGGLLLVAGRRALLLGDLPGARNWLTQVDALLVARPGMILIAGLRTALRIEVELAAGSYEHARQVLAAHDQSGRRAQHVPHDTANEPDPLAVPRARVLLAGGHPESVRDTVAGALDQAGNLGAEAWLVVSLAEDRLRHDAASTEALARALDLGAGEGVRLPFLRPNDRLAAKLRLHLSLVGTHREFVDDVLATAASTGERSSDFSPEPMTDRELSVLACLPTMSSNIEIAEMLGISVNTVKQHLKSVNRKLDVTSRRDAVRVARRLGVLPERPTSD